MSYYYDLTGTFAYCCELEVPGLFEDDIYDWDWLDEECLETKNDDHVALRLWNGYHFDESESVLCVLKQSISNVSL